MSEILCGDALDVLKTFPDAAFQTCVTSPPYYALRDYGVAGQIGLERTPEEKAAGADKLRRDLEKEKERADKAANETVFEKRARLKAEKERADLQTRIEELEENPVVTVREPTAEELAGIEEKLREKIGTEAEELRAENKKLRMAADPVMQKFRRYFDDWREAYAGMKTVIAEAETENETETADNLKTAVRKLVAAIAAEWK